MTISREEWQQKSDRAFKLMRERMTIPRVLIEVSSQHPLHEGEVPGAEFAARLDMGADLYTTFKRKGNDVKIYVPGSRHMDKGVADKVSLSQAGITYLKAKGIPELDLHGDDLTARYKGDDGVYNSGDEAYVAAQFFKDGNFGRLICVLSPAQIPRKPLHYIWNEVHPDFHTAPIAPDEMHHKFIVEVFDYVPMVVTSEPDFQGPDSNVAKLTRQNRIPKEEV